MVVKGKLLRLFSGFRSFSVGLPEHQSLSDQVA